MPTPVQEEIEVVVGEHGGESNIEPELLFADGPQQIEFLRNASDMGRAEEEGLFSTVEIGFGCLGIFTLSLLAAILTAGWVWVMY